jgi:hypothetical protein
MGAIALLMTGCGPLGGSSSESGSGTSTTLTITVWPQGAGGPRREWTLNCDPPGGSLPSAGSACERLTLAALKPLPRDSICTQIYGGPQVARVEGTVDGREVDSRFGRSNGCEIHRWDGVRFLLPVKI